MSEGETMVERVARAIMKADRSLAAGVVAGNKIDAREMAEVRARAAIEAMREPTHPMVCAGDGQDHGFGSMSAKVWRAMVDEALKPRQRQEDRREHDWRAV